MRSRALLLIATMELALGACSHKVTAPPNPQQARIGGVTVSLEASLNRDFMPITPPDGRPMIAVFEVRTVDGAPIPAGLEITHAIVMLGSESWHSTPTRLPYSDTGYLEAWSGDGPKWDAGALVDVEVTLQLGGETRELVAVQQLIRRSD